MSDIDARLVLSGVAAEWAGGRMGGWGGAGPGHEASRLRILMERGAVERRLVNGEEVVVLTARGEEALWAGLGAPGGEVPHWEGPPWKLYARGELIKELPECALNQIELLNALQANNWEQGTENPFRGKGNAKLRLRRTLESLNESQPLLRFRVDRDGRVGWKFRDSRDR